MAVPEGWMEQMEQALEDLRGENRQLREEVVNNKIGQEATNARYSDFL